MRDDGSPLNEPPRKLRVGGPGFGRHAGRITVLLDGCEVRRCVAFDVDAGTITRQRLDEAGRIYVDARTQHVATHTMRGKVEVRWK